MLPDKFYPVVSDIEWLRRFLPLGVKFIQLRLKDLSPDAIRTQSEQGVQLAKQHGAVIVINDYWELALDIAAPYVHLGQEDLRDADVQALKKAGIAFGISTHSLAELDYALSFKPDYIALGPIFAPIAKKMSIAPQGIARIPEWKQRIDLPLVCIGGITLDQVSAVLAAGADAVCSMGDVMFNPNPEQRAKEWLALTGR